MSKFLDKFIEATGPAAVYDEEKEQARKKENQSTWDNVTDFASNIFDKKPEENTYSAGDETATQEPSFFNNVAKFISDTAGDLYNTVFPFGNVSPIGLLSNIGLGEILVNDNMNKAAGVSDTARSYETNLEKGVLGGMSSTAGGIADIMPSFVGKHAGDDLNVIYNAINSGKKDFSGNILSKEYLTNPEGFTRDFGNMLGSMATLYPSSLLAPAKVASMAKSMSSNPVTQKTIETMLRGAMTSIPESLSEGGSVKRESIENGLNNPTLRGWATAAMNLPTLAASNALEYGLLGGGLFNPAKKAGEGVLETLGKIPFRATPTIGANTLQNGTEEFLQQGYQNLMTNKDYSFNPLNAPQDQIDAALIGAISSGVMAAPSSVSRAASSPRMNEYVEDIKEKANNFIHDKINDNYYQEQPIQEAQESENTENTPLNVDNLSAWKAANVAADEIGRPDLAKAIYSQWALESGRFTADNALRTNNFAGIKDPNKDGNYLQKFDSMDDFAREFVRQTIGNYDFSDVGEGDIKGYVHKLKENGYFSDDENSYAKNVQSIANEIQGEDNAGQEYDFSRPAPIQDGIYDTNLEHTDKNLHHAVDALNTWVYKNFGSDLVISGGWRDENYNASVNGSSTSHHLEGKALDVVIPDSFTQEQVEQIKAKAREMGFNSDGEDMYHDRGSGYHLHLTLPNGLKGDGDNRVGGKDNYSDTDMTKDGMVEAILNDNIGENQNVFGDDSSNENKKDFRFDSREKQDTSTKVNQKKDDITDNYFYKEVEPLLRISRIANLQATENILRRKASTSTNPKEANELYSFFKGYNPKNNLIDIEKAQKYVEERFSKEYSDEYWRITNALKAELATEKDKNANSQATNNNEVKTETIQKPIKPVNQNTKQAEPLINEAQRPQAPSQVQIVNTAGQVQNNELKANIANSDKGSVESVSLNKKATTPELSDEAKNEIAHPVVSSRIFENVLEGIDVPEKRKAFFNTMKNKVKLNGKEVTKREYLEAKANDPQYYTETINDKRYLIDKKNKNKKEITQGEYEYFNRVQSVLDLQKHIRENLQEQRNKQDTPEDKLAKVDNHEVDNKIVDKVNESNKNNKDNEKTKINTAKANRETNNDTNKTLNSSIEDKNKTEEQEKPAGKNLIKGNDNIEGKEITIITDDGTELKAKYKIISADNIITSHHAGNFSVNPKYPKELQPRNRERTAMKQQVIEMSQNLRPEDLAESRNLNNGAPVVNKDNVVLNGNGRGMAIVKVLKGPKEKTVGKKYKDYLIENADKFGINKEDVEKEKRPVLVREIIGTVSKEKEQEIITSTAGGSRIGASEQAKLDAEKITTKSLDLYVDNDKGDITTAANNDFVASVLYDIANKNDINAYLDKNGKVNADGIIRVKRALFSLAYGDDDLIAKISESTNDNVKNISDAFMRKAPALSKLNIKARNNESYKYDLSKTLSEAIKRISYLRDNNQSVDNYLSEQSMFNEYQDNDEVKEVVEFFDENKRKSNIIAKFIGKCADIIDKQGSPSQVEMFDSEKPTLKKVIELAKKYATGKGLQSNIFEDTETPDTKVVEQNEGKVDFGEAETAGNELGEMFGFKKISDKKKEKHAKKRIQIVDDSDEAMNKYKEQIKKALSNMSSNPMFNPDLLLPGFKLATAYLQRGINNFGEFSKTLIDFVGNDIKPWVKSLWNMSASYQGNDLDEKKLIAAFKYIGANWQHGEKDLSRIKYRFIEMFGEEQSKPAMKYIDVAYKGAEAYFNQDTPVIQLKENNIIDSEVEKNVNSSTGDNIEWDSKGNNKNNVGTDDENKRPANGNGRQDNKQIEQDRKTKSGVRVQSSSSDTGRTSSDSTVRRKISTDKNGSSRNSNLSRSVRDSYEGSTVSDEGRTEPISKPSEERQLDEGNLLKQDKAIPKEKASRLDDIKHDLPILLTEQQGDVLFAEERLIENKKPGVMFTNGTGTGKTYTGLGILKRFVNKGKKNILIVTPSNDINKAWIDAAKKDFDINITPLENTNDIGKDVVVTTYANMGYNNNLVNREWDLVLCDESHRLMSSEQAKVTSALNNLRALTYNHNGLNERFTRIKADEYKMLDNYADKIKAGEATEKEKKAKDDLFEELSHEKAEMVKQWQEIKEENKPKVVFLSATPFAYVPNVDYAEGYLFNYNQNKNKTSAYNDPNAREEFFIKNFGYRMRYNKLTKPDADVNTSLMEIEFHKSLEESGALSGRILTTSKDYDRGFILVDSGVGAKIDEGIQFLINNNKYDLLVDCVRNKLKGNKTRYILEAIKAKSAVNLVKQYLKGNKKVVIFHDFKKNEASNPFILSKEDFLYIDENGRILLNKEAIKQYELFKRERSDLINLNLKDLTSPINRFTEAFGDKIGIYNGSVDKKIRTNIIKEFNKDENGLDVILIQRASGKEGISLHDRTGKKQRILIDLGLPTRPTDAIQCEGRIYRVGVKSNAIFRYLNTGTNTEAYIFSSVIAERSSTAENLALGEKARNLKESFIETFEESRDSDSWKKYLPNSKTEGTGGVQRDRQQQLNITPFERAKSYYYANQKKTGKNKAKEGVDYYPTPEPIGYKMVEFADIKSGDSVLEPSAGHGAIARFFPEDTKNVAIEPSSELANTIRLRFNKNGRVIESTFENYDVHNKFNDIVMNPPYGTAAKTAMEHLEKAFNHLRDGGRIVALLPAGNSMGKRLDKWLNGVPNAKTKAEREGEKRAVIMKKIELPSVTFERAGTKVVTDIYIIDKYENEADREKALKIKEGTLSFRNIDAINTLFDEIEDVIAPRRILKGDVIQEEAQEYNDNISNDNVDENTSIQENSDDMFEITDFKHTKTGEIMKRVKVKEQMDFQQLKSLAKQSGGGYSRFAKGFLFSSSEDRQKFVNAVRGITDKEQSSNYSFAEDMYKRLDDYVDIREKADFDNVKIGDYEKEISAIGDRMGTPIYWFTGPKGFRGWHSHGTTYLNVNGNWSHPKVFWHETFHWIARNNPSLFNDMLNDMKKRITSKQINDYRKIVWRGDKLSEDKIIEEMMADSFYDVVKRVKYLRNLGKENKSLAKRLITFIRDLMNRFTDFLNNPKAKLTNTQKKSMLKNFNNLALSMVDNHGNKLFEHGKDGEIKLNDNRDFYSISKEEEESLINQYGENYMSVLFDDDGFNSQLSADNDKSIDGVTGIFKGAFKNIKKRFNNNKKDERIKIYNKSARDTKIDELGNIGGFEAVLSSPARLAEKYVAFKPVFNFADNAMRKQLKNRSYYIKSLGKAFDCLENKKKDMEELNDLMFTGDALSKEYGKGITNFEERADKIIEETGVKMGTAKAYIIIRNLLDECYELINRARTQVQTKSETISKSKLEGLKQNKFVNILDEVQSEKDKDDVLVTYEIRPSHIRQDVCNKEQLEALRNNEAIQILEEKEGVTEKDGSTHIYGDDYSTPKGEKINLDNNKLYTVKYREAIPKVNKLEGYVPHFFHDFYVVVQNDDGTTTTVDSGRNVKEAYKKAEQYLKDNENAKLIIRPKKFDFNEVGIDEEYYAEMVGDGAYKKINERISSEFDMNIDDVEQLLNIKNKTKNKIRRSSKHRFFGNIQHRTGAKGYEDEDLNWVLSHYFNSACRYEALETEFKPLAISYFERMYGRFGTDNKYLSGTARYIKDYINDVNGNPSALENSISTWLNNRRLWRYLFTSRYGERAALSVATNITNKISILKLGVWNVSSAMLNLTQLLNSTALLTDKNPVKSASEISKAIKDIAALTEGQTEKRISKLSPDERKAMEDTGVLHELGLDSGAGYSKTSFGKWGDRSMILFKASERLARCSTILAAYRKARNVLNKNHDEAVEYAREINRKANFDYGVNDAPNVFRRGSIISQILLQFMKYPIKQFELMRDFIPFNGKKDATWQQKATFWGGWIFFAGAFGLPAEDLLWALVGFISEPVFGVSPKQAVRQFLLEASKDASLPERVAIRTLLYGGLSNVGIDISSRVGMADIIPGLGEDYNKDANPVIKNLEKFGGATGGTIAQFYLNATKGDNLGMLRAISPGAYNMYTAAIGESKDGRGRITTKYDDAMSRIIRGMGFKSTNETIDTELGSLKYYNMSKTSKERQSAIDDYLDAEERKENLAPYIKKLNELGVKRSTVVKARKDRKKDRRERLKEKDTPEYYQGAEALSW